jgi:hypothetical protein
MKVPDKIDRMILALRQISTALLVVAEPILWMQLVITTFLFGIGCYDWQHIIFSLHSNYKVGACAKAGQNKSVNSIIMIIL